MNSEVIVPDNGWTVQSYNGVVDDEEEEEDIVMMNISFVQRNSCKQLLALSQLPAKRRQKQTKFKNELQCKRMQIQM